MGTVGRLAPWLSLEHLSGPSLVERKGSVEVVLWSAASPAGSVTFCCHTRRLHGSPGAVRMAVRSPRRG
eukprot:6948683-Alexandrium_andersonii.AAC.1